MLPASDDPYGIDLEALREAAALLGDIGPQVASYFLKDGADYLRQLGAALACGDAEAAALPAHTLKSSSRQFGLVRLGALCERAEAAALAQANGAEAENLAFLLHQIQRAFDEARPWLESRFGLGGANHSSAG